MKRYLLTLIFLCSLSISALWAESGSCGSGVYWNLSGNTLTISGSGAMYDYDEPQDNQNPWEDPGLGMDDPEGPGSMPQSNSAPWYDYNPDFIQNVVIENGVTYIGEFCFAKLNNLTSVSLPTSLTTIGSYAFFDCDALSTIHIPGGVQTIGESAFSSCYHLSTISFSEGLTTIERYAFDGCSNLSSVELPNTLTTIREFAFLVCDGLTTLVLPASVQTIGHYAFQTCYHLTDVTVNWTSLAGLSLGNNPFYGVNTSNVRLHVPAGRRSMYATTYPWSGFRIIEGALPGKFSISASKQIKFSCGNLQYQASSGYWRFAEHQYDYVGNTSVGNVTENDVKCSNTNISSSYSGWIDLFGWATSGNSASGTAYQPYSSSKNDTEYGPAITSGEWTAANSDWGVVNATQLGSGWRTLSSSEWGYLLSSRPNATNLRTFATVCDVQGLILLPDGWTASGVTLSITTANFTTNTINASDWATLEAQGAVFMPKAGFRLGTAIYDAGTQGCYWTSTASDATHAAYLDFYNGLLSPMTYNRFYGYAVRLTHELSPSSVTSAPTAKTGLAYTGSAQALVNAGIASGGTMYYSLNNSTWSTAIPTGTDAGNYTVYYKVVGDADHSDFTPASNTVTVTINVASITTSGSVTTYYTTLASAVSAWEANSTLTLLADVTTSSKVEVSNTRTIDLNGYGIKMTGTDCIFLVQQGGDLTMIDSNPTRSTRRFNVSDYLATLNDGGAYSFQGGYLTGGRGSTALDWYYRGGAVFLKGANCRFTMRGGTILGNRASFGGGVQVRQGRFVMEGGAIIYNRATERDSHGGGAVFVDCGSGQLTLGGTALIEHNYANGYDNGQVYVAGCTNGALVISGGSPRVINSASTNNIIHNSAIMTITGALTADADLPLYISQPGVLTSGYSTYNGNTDPNTFFSVQNSGYTLRLNADGEVHAVIPSSVSAAPTAKTGLVYTGAAQELVTAGTASGGTMYYSLDNSNWSTSIPTATALGDYTVYYKVVGDANHADFTPASNTVAVSIVSINDIPLTFEAKTAGAQVTYAIYVDPEELAMLEEMQEFMPLSEVLGDLPPVEYSKNGGAWTTYSDPITLENVGDKVSFRGNNSTYLNSQYRSAHFDCSVDCYIYGNIMSLVEATNYAAATTLTGEMNFYMMFKDNQNIKNHDSKDLVLPATNLSSRCYDNMFTGCTGLTRLPELPATTLVDGCYMGMFTGCTGLTTLPVSFPNITLASACYCAMFKNCTGLTSAPVLPVATLTEDCYLYMFQGCTGLTTIPENMLPATTLTSRCYCAMFDGCTSLTSVPEDLLPATTLADMCYDSMFEGCTCLTNAPALPATTLTSQCYDNMFSGCTALISAPELPATKLVNWCYGRMFYHCPNISSVICRATSSNSSYATYLWLDGVAESGTFYAPSGSVFEGQSRDASHIPVGWVVVDPAASKVTIDAWTSTGMVVTTASQNLTGKTATIYTNGTQRATSLSLDSIDAGIWSIPASLNTYKGQKLVVAIYDGSTMVGVIDTIVPYIVTEDALLGDLSVPTNADVQVVAGTLTVEADAAIGALDIYPDAKVVVTTGINLSVNSLTMRADGINNGYPQLVANGNIINANNDSIYYDYTVDWKQYYPLAVPYDVSCSAIRTRSGKPASFEIQWYNSEDRAANAHAWTVLDDQAPGATLHTGQGYIIYGVPYKWNNTRQKTTTIRFPMKADLTAGGEQAKTVPIHLYGNEGTNASNRNWNFIANPYLASYRHDNEEGPLQPGTYDPDTSTPEVESYTPVVKPYRYVTTSYNGYRSYIQMRVKFFNMQPFHGYFVQAAEEGILTFSIEHRAQYAPRKQPSENQTSDELELGIVLSGAEAEDRTGLLYGDAFTDEYELNADLVKLFGSAQGLSVYSLADGEERAFNALATADTYKPVPIGFRNAPPGELTFAIDDEHYDTSVLEAVYLTDYEQGTTVNLLEEDYSFTTTVAQNDTRFALQTVLPNKVPTDLDTITNHQSTNGRYDVMGRPVTGNVLPAGVYIIIENGKSRKEVIQ